MRRILLLLIAIAGAIHAQKEPAPSSFLMRVWQTEEGLPGNVVRSLGQSPDGYLWIATAEGIARFDGLEFTTFGAGGQSSERRLGFFRVFTPADGSVWTATFRGGLFKVTDGGLVRVVEDVESRPTRITRLIVFEGDPYFIREEQLWTLNNDVRLAVTEISPGLAAALEADRVKQALRGRSDESENPTRLTDRLGGKWQLESGSLRYIPADGSPPSPRVPDFGGVRVVHDFLEDREGNVWLASPVQGLIRIRHSRVAPLATPDGIYNHPVQAALRGRGGTWWLANRSGGVDRIHDGVTTHHPLSTSGHTRSVSCIFEDRAGRLWFASRDASVFEWVEGAFKVVFPGTPEFSKVHVITEDNQGVLWFGGQNGLWRLAGTDLTNFHDEAVLEGAEFTTLTHTPDGRLIAGTSDGRVFARTSGTFKLLGRPGDLHARWVSAIVASPSDEIWVSTIGAGLFLWKNERWHRFGTAEGIPDERLTALTLIGDDSLWIGSLGGILRASRFELVSRITNKEATPHWLRLDRSDGMVTRECVGGSQPGVFRDDDDTLWFPTPVGLAGVNPSRIAINAIPPELHWQPVEINGVARPVGIGPIIAGPGRARIRFHFTGISLSAPDKVSYQVQLVGLDERPRLIGSRREADYQAVPPGSYVFEVSATNGDGVSNLRPAVLPFEIRPHLWETKWFVSLVASGGLLIALAIGWSVARRRSKTKLQELRLRGLLEAERSRISSDLHDELGANLTELSILSEIAAEDPDDENLRPSMGQLTMKARRVVSALDEIVWATNPTEDSLQSLVEYLTAFVREFLESVQIPLRTQIERQVPAITLGPRRRHNVFLATREAVNNAVKHAKAKSIFLRIALEDGQLVICIQDDGRGFSVEYAASGEGLANLNKRMTDCGGTCRIESTPGQGTTVTLTIPLPAGSPS